MDQDNENEMDQDNENEMDHDRAFGQWLKDRRITRGLTLYQASICTEIPERRLKEIEDGDGRSIRRQECIQLAVLYRMNLIELLECAQGYTSGLRKIQLGRSAGKNRSLELIRKAAENAEPIARDSAIA